MLIARLTPPSMQAMSNTVAMGKTRRLPADCRARVSIRRLRVEPRMDEGAGPEKFVPSNPYPAKLHDRGLGEFIQARKYRGGNQLRRNEGGAAQHHVATRERHQRQHLERV